MSVVASEGESLLTSLKTGGHISAAHTATSSPSSTATSSPPSMHATQLAQSHLSRRVSFNRDVVMVLSDTIGQGSDSSSVVPPVEEGQRHRGCVARRPSEVPVSARWLTFALHVVRILLSFAGDEEASTDGRPKKVFTGAPSLAEKESSAHRREESRERRLSRTEFNEGLILKQHLDLSDLEKDEIRNTATAVQ
jgi:hypothetical protein